jgi:hypothetical protein
MKTAKPFVFVTKNSAPVLEDFFVKLRHLGVEGLSSRHFYASVENIADVLP